MGLLKYQTFSTKLFSLMGIMIAGLVVGSVISIMLVKPVFGVDVVSDPSILNPNEIDPSNLPILKFLQLLQSIFFFIIPANLFAYWASEKDATGYLGFHSTKPLFYFLGAMVILTAAPAIAGLAIWNESLYLPGFLKSIEEWMRNKENQAGKITELFLQATDTRALFVNLLVIAFVPAIGEELIFRGILQKLFLQKTRNVHWAVLLTAIIFSAIHLQFLGFVPRLVLGALLGYLYIWSGSIWVPIIAHFVNNGTAVLASYLYQTRVIQTDLNQEENFALSTVLLSFLISFVLILYFYKNRKISSSDGERLG